MSTKSLEKPPSKPHLSNNPWQAPLLCVLAFAVGLCGTCLALPGCNTRQGRGAPCQAPDDCLPGLKCLDQRCADGLRDSPCRTSSDCQQSAGFLCSPDGLCQRAREAQVEPPETTPDQDERPLPDLLTPPEPPEGCRNSKDCPSGTLCLPKQDGRSASCQPTPLPCKRDADCLNEPAKTCRLIEQRDGTLFAFCAPNFATTAPRAELGSSCTRPEDCQSNLCLLPFFNQCGGLCQTTQDCPEGFYCGLYSFDQQGDFQGCIPTCEGSGGCPDGYRCTCPPQDPQCARKQCQPQGPPQWGGPCIQTQDCPPTGRCQSTWPGGLCTRDCTPQNSTPCDQEGAQGSPCQGEQRCLRNPFTGTLTCASPCPDGMQCRFVSYQRALCLSRCQQDTDCRQDHACNTQQLCVPRGLGNLGDPCQRDQDCRSTQCALFPNGRYCTERCSSRCPTGFFCQFHQNTQMSQGRCERTCRPGECQSCQRSSCQEVYRCNASQQCQLQLPPKGLPDGSPCQQDEQCLHRRCLRGPLFPQGLCTQSCTQDAPCAGDFLCLDIDNNGAVCLPHCTPDGSSSTCPRKHYRCEPIYLQQSAFRSAQISCTSQTSCPALPTPFPPGFCVRDEQRTACAVGVCLGQGSLLLRAACANNLECSTGLCVFPRLPALQEDTNPPCTNDTQCPTTAPYCNPQRERCVPCRTNQDCDPNKPLCRLGQCSSPGVCSQTCAEQDPCPAQTTCTQRIDRALSPLPDACLPTCQDDLDCQRGFRCVPTSATETLRSCQPHLPTP